MRTIIKLDTDLAGLGRIDLVIAARQHQCCLSNVSVVTEDGHTLNGPVVIDLPNGRSCVQYRDAQGRTRTKRCWATLDGWEGEAAA